MGPLQLPLMLLTLYITATQHSLHSSKTATLTEASSHDFNSDESAAAAQQSDALSEATASVTFAQDLPSFTSDAVTEDSDYTSSPTAADTSTLRGDVIVRDSRTFLQDLPSFANGAVTEDSDNTSSPTVLRGDVITGHDSRIHTVALAFLNDTVEENAYNNNNNNNNSNNNTTVAEDWSAAYTVVATATAASANADDATFTPETWTATTAPPSSNGPSSIAEVRQLMEQAGLVPLAVIGVALNLLSLWVWQGDKSYNATTFLFKYLAVSDSLCLVTLILFVSRLDAVMREVVLPISNVSQRVSVHTTLLVAVTRWLAVTRPLHARSLLSAGRVRAACVGLLLWCLLLEGLYFYSSFAPITRSVPCLLLRPVNRSVPCLLLLLLHHQVSAIIMYSSFAPTTRSVPCLLLLLSTPSPGRCHVYSSFDRPHHQVSALSTLPSIAPITRSVPCLLFLRSPHHQVSALSTPSARHQVSAMCIHPSPPSPGQCHMYSSFSPITRSMSYLLLRSHRLVSAICTPN